MDKSKNLIEPRIKYIFDRKIRNRAKGPYAPKTAEEVRDGLLKLFKNMGMKKISVTKLGRMAGGASKEQFSFELTHEEQPEPIKLVLRLDPLEGIVETCRLREGELLSALNGIVPVPAVFAIDGEGEYLGQPALICSFVGGVAAPTSEGSRGVTGIGSAYGSFAHKLAPQFVDYLAKLHSWENWNSGDMKNFVIPKAGTTEAAVYQVNQWSLAWKIDKVEPVPIITFTEHWLRENAPSCDRPCLIHCDYRIGNFLFSEETAKITAILDWELAHFGDFHEDLAWILHRFFGSEDAKGNFLVCGLMERELFLEQYQEKSGRIIDEDILLYYEVLNAWKCAVMTTSLGVNAARNRNNHQELLLSWLSMGAGVHLDQVIKKIYVFEERRKEISTRINRVN